MPPASGTAGVLLRFAGRWAFGASVATATVSALARALCLPPYWPAELLLRCRPEGLLPALARALPDAVLTAALLFVPALAVGAGPSILARLTSPLLPPRITRILVAIAGTVLWFVMVARLEPSHLDFIVSGYATAAGALAGAALSSRTISVPRAA